MNRDVELEFGSIDSSGVCVSLQHLRRPCLVKRTKLFRQPSGSDEGAGAIPLRAATNCSGWVRSDRQRPVADRLCGRPFLSESANYTPVRYSKDGLSDGSKTRPGWA